MVVFEQVTLDVVVNRKRRQVLDNCDFSFDLPRMAVLAEDPVMRSSVIGLVTGRVTPQRGRIRRAGRISWAIGPTLPFRSNLTGRQTIAFVCDVYDASRAQAEALAHALIDAPFDLDLPTTRWPIPAVVQFSYVLALAPRFDTYVIDGPIRLGYPRFYERWRVLFEERVRRRPLVVSSAQITLLPKLATKGALVKDGILVRVEDVAAYLKTAPQRAAAAPEVAEETSEEDETDIL